LGRKSAGLQPKHYKALELLAEGSLSIKEVGEACGIEPQSMYALVEGDIGKLGQVAALFQSQLNKLNAKTNDKIRVLSKDSKKKALYMINERLTHLKRAGNLGEREVREVTRIMNTLTKSTPTVEFNQNVSIYKGYSPEEIVHEFKRLSAVARHTLNGTGVPGFKQRRAGEILDSAGDGSPVAEE